MNKINLFKGALLCTIVLCFASCSEYSKLLKSGDSELMYNGALKLYEEERYQKAIQLFADVSPVYSGTAKEDSISYFTATSYYKLGDFDSSSILLDDFRRRFGRSPFVEDVEYMYAKGFYFSSPQAERDQTVTHTAIYTINDYLSRYPNSVKKDVLLDNVAELTSRLHDKTFMNAKTYYTIGKYKSAVVALKNASVEYPDSEHREPILYLVVKSNYRLAMDSYYHLQRDRYLDMMDAYYTFVAEYPESSHRKEVDKMMDVAKKHIAKFSDDKKVDELSTDDGDTKKKRKNSKKR